MPIYEYKCADCGAHFEKIQKTTDEPLKTCEKCAGRLEKQWSLSGFQFKGEGWYVTDYARGGKNGADKAEDKTEKAGKTDTADTAEKSSAAESTKGDGSASKDTNTKKETVTKKE